MWRILLNLMNVSPCNGEIDGSFFYISNLNVLLSVMHKFHVDRGMFPFLQR